MRKPLFASIALVLPFAVLSAANADGILPPVNERFANPDVAEVPNFQRHVVPLFGRLGCNGRACHGSFQGQGGFRLSLFGYDFQADHEALLGGRVNPETPARSLILNKPTDEDNHEGGLRYEKGSWQYHVFRRWIEGGAEFKKSDVQKLVQLEVIPSEIVFNKEGEQVRLQAIAHWEDGAREDVTTLCRFQTNSGEVAGVNEGGLITANQPGDTHVVVFYDNAVEPIPVLRPVTDLTGNRYPKVATPTKIDELVVDKLRKLGTVPSDACSDEEFLRRISLDMTGTLPTAEQVVAFLENQSPNKRAEKIEELLASPAYAAWWTTKLCDFTGNNDFQLRNFLPQYNRNAPTASQAWYDWIYQRVEQNVPYDELTEGIVMATSRDPGQSYTEYCEEMSQMFRDGSDKTPADLGQMPLYWARREFRDAEPRAINFAYAFLGIRIQCAQCHKHPFDEWSKEDFAEFTNFFRQVAATNGRPVDRDDRKEYEALLKQLDIDPSLRGNQQRREFGQMLTEGKTVPFSEVYVGNVRPSRGDSAAETDMTHARLLGGEAFKIERGEDIRQPLMDWLRTPDNPYFARAFVNRVWASYFNRGIVDPPDDNSLANPPVNKPLLDYLTNGFIENGYDMKWVHRTIANSDTYQRSWRPNETNGGDETNFSRCVPRRLPAEVVYDAITSATASDDAVAGIYKDLDGRAIAIPGASNRANNNGANYALSVFGKSTRESNCDCDRSMEASLLQTVFLQNDRDMYQLLDRRNGWLDQVARQHNLKRPAAQAAPQRRRPANYDELIENQRKRLKRAKQQGNQRLVAQLQRQLDRHLDRFGRPTSGGTDSAAPEKASVNSAALVEQAYLRTLSRHPNEQELAKSVTFIDESGDTLNGIRGLLWALINTKEFIVNH